MIMLVDPVESRRLAAGSAVPSRRTFLKVTGLASGALLVAIHFPSASEAADVVASSLRPSALLSIDAQGRVHVTCAYVEMGQGIFTAVAMLVAEELEVELQDVTIEQAPADDKLFAHPIFGTEITGGSASVRGAYTQMRQAAATGRTMLVAAAAQRWNVPPDTCRAESGHVTHTSSRRMLNYGELVSDAARLPVPADVAIKAPSDFKLVGKPTHRVDTLHKVDGGAQYGIDFQIPGMLLAAIAMCPVFGGKLGRVNDTQTMAIKGVRRVVRLDDAVVVVADHTGAARQGLAALEIEWHEGANAHLVTQDLGAELKAALKSKGFVQTSRGDFDAALRADGAQRIDYSFESPLLAHAPMEPMNCTIFVRDGRCDLWMGTQAPQRAKDALIRVTGLAPDKVEVHNFLIGGGFGRRLDADYVENAVRVAQQFDVPIKLIWSREQDIQHDIYKPCFHDEVSAVVDQAGTPTAFKHRFAGSAVIARYRPIWLDKGLDTDATDGAASSYRFPNHYVEFVPHELPAGMVTGFWRGVGPTHNMAVLESCIDDLAFRAGKDPVAFRRMLLKDQPRALAVLELAATKANWKTNAPAPRTGRGVAFVGSVSWNSYVAAVVDVKVHPDGSVELIHVTTAVDCGQPINPDGIVQQVESGHIFGLTSALYGNITIKGGRVEQSNFHDYRVLRMNEAPSMEVHLVASHEPPGGMGEIGTSVIQPALLNAIFSATGKRLMRLPIDPEQLKST